MGLFQLHHMTKYIYCPQFEEKKPNEMGYLNNKNSQEFYLHLGLEITPERLCLGVIDFNT